MKARTRAQTTETSRGVLHRRMHQERGAGDDTRGTGRTYSLLLQPDDAGGLITPKNDHLSKALWSKL